MRRTNKFVCLFICPKTYDTKRWDGLTDLKWRQLCKKTDF